MGKKQIETLNKMKSKFIDGASQRNYDPKQCEKIWTDWEKFAQYAFNKSHSTCYAYVAYQTAYLKAHYPAEYMATVLSHNLNNLDKMSVFMDECKSIGIQVLGPDINESDVYFTVNKQGNIRFGLSGINGVGEQAAREIVTERTQNGPYEDAFDLAKRIKSRQLNKRVLESLARSGAFDFDSTYHRSQYFVPSEDGVLGLDLISRYGVAAQEAEASTQVSLFGEAQDTENFGKPKLPNIEPMPQFLMLAEKHRALLRKTTWPGAKKISLEYELLKHINHYSLLKVIPSEGKFHQIRAQLSKAGNHKDSTLKYLHWYLLLRSIPQNSAGKCCREGGRRRKSFFP